MVQIVCAVFQHKIVIVRNGEGELSVVNGFI